MSTFSLTSETSSFAARNVPFRRVDARGAFVFERDGASFRFAAPTTRPEIRVFQATKNPVFLAFNRDGQTFYEPTLSVEAAPVYSPFFAETLGDVASIKREHFHRVADLTESARTRIYDPTFLERLGVAHPLSINELSLARYSPLRTGNRLNAFWNRASGRWEVVAPPEFNVVRFQLTSALTLGSTATAAAFYFDSTTQTFVDGGLKIDVADFLGRFQGAVGTRGYARRFADSAAWEIFALNV